MKSFLLKFFYVFTVIAIMVVAASNFVLSSELSIDDLKSANIVVLADDESSILPVGCSQAELGNVISDDEYERNADRYKNYVYKTYCGDCREHWILPTSSSICFPPPD